MVENGKEEILVMALFKVTKDDIIACAKELGMPEEKVTDEVIGLVKQRISQDLGNWQEILKGMIKKVIKCPLGLVCSPACTFREVGKCVLPGVVK